MKYCIKIFFILIFLTSIFHQANSVEGEIITREPVEEKIAGVGIDITDSLPYKSIQKRSLSCEISATSDILSFFEGTKIDEDTLLGILKKSDYESLPYKKDGNLYWGNPHEGFVGYIDSLPNGETARQRKMTGYGVLEKPILEIFTLYDFKTKFISLYNYTKTFREKEHLTEILTQVEKGNMVQLWGDICTNPEYAHGSEHSCFHDGKESWDQDRSIAWKYTDTDGSTKEYTGLIGEHAFILLGYKGNLENPSHVIVWDTYTGRHEYATSEWMRKWKMMEYRSIIVYKK